MKTRIILSFLFLLSGLVVLAQGDGDENRILLDKVIAVVGDKPILHSEIEMQYAQSSAQGIPTEGLKCSILEQLLLEKLLMTQAVIDSVVVSEDEVEGELENRLRYWVQMLGGEDKFEAYYQKSVSEFKDDFREDVRNLLLAQRMQGEIVGNLSVTPSEVKAFFEEIPKDSLPYFNAEVEIKQVVIKPEINKEERDKAWQKLQDIRKRIVEGGENFEELARVYSQDPGSGPNGGCMGFVNRGDFVKEYEATAFRMKDGEISEIVESEFGLHVIKLVERRGNKINTCHILIKPEITTNDIAKTKGKLDSLRTLILADSITFQYAVERFSEDETSQSMGGTIMNAQTGSPIFSMDQMEQDVYFVIESLKEGEISEPSEMSIPGGDKAYRIILVASRTQPHVANLQDDYSKIQSIALVRKQEQKMKAWITSRVKQTFVKIDPAYVNCDLSVIWVQ